MGRNCEGLVALVALVERREAELEPIDIKVALNRLTVAAAEPGVVADDRAS